MLTVNTDGASQSLTVTVANITVELFHASFARCLPTLMRRAPCRDAADVAWFLALSSSTPQLITTRRLHTALAAATSADGDVAIGASRARKRTSLRGLAVEHDRQLICSARCTE